MSEDDYSRADSSAVQPHVPGKHRGPRFTWTAAYEITFFRSLCESVQMGLREGMTFKPEAWDRAQQALLETHRAYANKGHLINKSDNARKKYRMWRGLRESPDFLYNPTTKTITGTEDAWKRHIEKEPLSRSLKGRPFEYEEYYEVLFPDVIGTGGAPKRVTSRKRKTIGGSEIDDSLQPEHGTPGTTVMNLLADVTYGNPQSQQQQQAMSGQQQHQVQQHQQQQQHQQNQSQQRQSIPTSSPALNQQQQQQQQQQRPTNTALPPRTSITSTSALTPPEETPGHARGQRFLAPGSTPTDPQLAQNPLPPSTRQRGDPTSHSSKRQRADTNNNTSFLPPPSTSLTSQVTSLTTPSSLPQPSLPPGAQGQADSLTLLAEALRSSKSARPGNWSEQALDIFFRDFGEEDMDLQIKIAEKALAADENKAMVFVKMPVVLRRHWVKRLREVHLGQSHRG